MAKQNENQKRGVSQFDAARLAELEKQAVSGGAEELAGELTKLEVGDSVTGRYISKGSYETEDQKTGELKNVAVYEIQTSDGTKVRIGGLTRLDTAFGALKIGDTVAIFRTPDISSGRNRKVAGFRVFKLKA